MSFDPDMEWLTDMLMLRGSGLEQFLLFVFVPGRASAKNGHASIGLSAQLLEVFPLVAKQLADKVVAGEIIDGDDDFVANLDSGFVIEVNVLRVGGWAFHQ